jgi:hypothetical protein
MWKTEMCRAATVLPSVGEISKSNIHIVLYVNVLMSRLLLEPPIRDAAEAAVRMRLVPLSYGTYIIGGERRRMADLLAERMFLARTIIRSGSRGQHQTERDGRYTGR